MRVITSSACQFETMFNLEHRELVFHDFGPSVHCKGGGGSSGGGGGGSGQVDYPSYMKTVHNDWLDNTATTNFN